MAFVFYLLSFVFSPYGVLSFWIKKFLRCIKSSHKMSLEVEVLTGLSVIVNLMWLLKL